MVSKKDMKTILLFVILISLVLIIIFTYVIIEEIVSAKNGCKLINETYKIKNFNHFCDDKPFFRYSDGTWDFDREMSSNYTIVFPN